MKAMTLKEATRFVFTVAALLMLDVLVRAIVGGYHAAHLGGFDVTLAIAGIVIWMNHRAERSTRA